jgi:uncharacterized membrane protein
MKRYTPTFEWGIGIALGIPVLFAFGPGIWGDASEFLQRAIPYRLIFQSLCHQIADRCYILNGWIMPVCSRCLGIYLGLFGGWILGVVFGSTLPRGKKLWGVISLFWLLLNIADVLFNIIGMWDNTLSSRLVLGIALSVSATFYIRS